ncbi:MAG: serine/threonine-protein kinase [Polyangiaceae bacterium]
MASGIKDRDLIALSGTLLESPRHSATRYRLGPVIGEGAQGVVFRATQHSAEGELTVVVKVLRPRAIRDLPGLAATAIGKEVSALERLAAQTPTPFVVQFFDTGTLRVGDHALELPWVAVEYVDGGVEGATLRARVAAAIADTGHAFDLTRAARAARCMLAGVRAIHEVGVIHRDINPGNVLCTGNGDSEVFKVADFGLARVSSALTYGNVLLGTPGYCSPEQSFPDKIGVGPYSDVFALACTLYFTLTGEPYFTAPTIPESLVAVYAPERRRILDARGVCEELRARPELCAEWDRVFAKATHADPRLRPQSVGELGLPGLAS